MTLGWPIKVVIFLFAIIFHEFFHGRIAYALGDDTAKLSGRVTLNPIPHIDPFGTIILPIMSFLMGGFIIGWAKPVPYNPYNLKNPRSDSAKIGAAGPIGNFLLAGICSFLLWIILSLNIFPYNARTFAAHILVFSIFANILLAVFNLLPVPPLDGSKILAALLPERGVELLERIQPFSFMIIIVLFMLNFFSLVLLPLVYSLMRVFLFWYGG